MSRIEDVRKMLASDPDDVFLNFALAMEYTKADQHEEAAAQFARVIELDPAYVAAYKQQADALIALGRRDDAAEVLRHGIEAARKAGDHHATSKMTDALALLE